MTKKDVRPSGVEPESIANHQMPDMEGDNANRYTMNACSFLLALVHLLEKDGDIRLYIPAKFSVKLPCTIFRSNTNTAALILCFIG